MIKQPLDLEKPVDFKEGEVILINKPLDWTSFNVVAKIRGKLRHLLRKKWIKVGHAGTLDPLASGLIIICTGNQTKQIEKYQGLEKEYIAEITFGAVTPSYDLETQISKKFETEHITRQLIEEKLKTFIGKQMQVPPVFSAKRIEGKRAYDLARQGQEVKMTAKQIEISEIEILKFLLPVLKIRVKCSKGTYIRSLANDIGAILNSGAYLSALQRTAIGNYSVDESIEIEEFIKYVEKIYA